MAVDPPPGQPCAPRAAAERPTDVADGVADGRGTAALNAPVRSLKMLELQVSAGATEIYLALLPPDDVAVSFDALPANRDGEPTHVTSARMLKELIASAHKAGLSVHFAADAPVVAPDHEPAFVEHVDRAVDAGADTVVVGSLATCDWLAQSRPDVALVAGSAMGVSTIAFAVHLRDAYVVRRIVLPHTVTLEEVAAFCALDGLQIEVPVQTGSGLDCTRCRLADTAHIGLGCRAGYAGAQNGEPVTDLGGFLDGASDCALCDVATLIELGVTALQIPGRESPNLRQNAKLTQLYRRAVSGHEQAVPITDVIIAIDRVELMWQMGWMPRLCEQHRCRFRETPQKRAFV